MLCDYCGTPITPGEEYDLVHGHRCNYGVVDTIGNMFANTLAVMMGGDSREKRYIIHKECVGLLFVHREIRRRT